MKWIKATDRKPIGNTQDQRVCTKFNGNPDTLIFLGENWYWLDQINGQSSRYPVEEWSQVEWLDESPQTNTLPSLIDGSLEQRADKYIREMFGPGCCGRMVDKLKAAFIAGANSSQHSGDAAKLDRKKIKEIFLKHICLSDSTDGYVVSATNELTIEDGFIAALEECLSRSTPTPPGIMDRKELKDISDEDALFVFNIGGGPAISNEAKIYQVKEILTTNKFYNAQTNIPGRNWWKIFYYLISKGYDLDNGEYSVATLLSVGEKGEEKKEDKI